MTCDNNEVERTQIIGMLFGAYGQSNDSQRQAIYSKMLADIPNAVLKKAVKKIILENKFVPTVSEIVAAAKNLIETVDESKRVKSWMEAWAEIQKQMQDAFVYKKPVFSTPEIESAAMAFGWIALCTTLEKDMPTVRAQVRQLYENACKRRTEADMNGYVLGKNSDGLLSAGQALKRLRPADEDGENWDDLDKPNEKAKLTECKLPKLGNYL